MPRKAWFECFRQAMCSKSAKLFSTNLTAAVSLNLVIIKLKKRDITMNSVLLGGVVTLALLAGCDSNASNQSND